MRRRDMLDLTTRRVLDGAMATELECRGVSTAGPLWSARALSEAPDAVLAVHREYLDAGADVLLTASYQASSIGFASAEKPDEDAAKALRHSVELAAQAREEADKSHVLVAASLGPYGAALANGAEFHGRYGFSNAKEEHRFLVAFHRERIAVLAATDADLLAFETVPSLHEARAIAEALQPWPEIGCWISWTCRDGGVTAYGESIRECAAWADKQEQILALGVNCTSPSLIADLLEQMKSGTRKPLVVYPNSGEGWDAERHCWTGLADVEAYGRLAEEWFAHGAQIVGGCCRTGPAHVRAVTAAARIPASAKNA